MRMKTQQQGEGRRKGRDNYTFAVDLSGQSFHVRLVHMCKTKEPLIVSAVK